jgi:beta-glucosidase-like glycosyl hydrolase
MPAHDPPLRSHPETHPETHPGALPSALKDLAHSLVVPALRWNGTEYRVDGSDATPPDLMRAGVAGFILFGGTARAAHDLIAALRTDAGRPLLFGADLERGAGQQLEGATRLPPAGALGDLDDVEVTRAAGELTAREARSLGLDMVFAPVADVAADPDSPIVGPRAFSADAGVAARHVAAWVGGALGAGVLPCVKHFPGHGRASGDSHVGRVRVTADAAALDHDLAPFRAGIEAGVPLVMPGHLVVPALDPEGRIATVSPPMLSGLLRERLGFDGVVVTDALLMAGAGDLARTAVGALRAGVDLLLYPESVETAVEALVAAAADDPAFWDRMRAAHRRVGSLAQKMENAREGGRPSPDAHREGWASVGGARDRERAMSWATASVRRVRGDASPPGPDGPVRVIDVDDDVGGPYPPPSRAPFRDAMAPVETSAAATVIALWADTRGWKGRAGLSAAAAAALRGALSAAADSASVHVVVFGGPRAVVDVPTGPTVWLAWGGEALMQVAAAHRLREAST